MKDKIIQRSASGKVILCGEHSVVYGRPAIAVPISDLRAYARVTPLTHGSGMQILAPDLEIKTTLQDAEEEHPLAKITHLVLNHLDAPVPDASLTITSDLPIAAGMGSGAAVTVAAARALGAFFGQDLPTDVISEMTYEVEKIHHGTPSGIDNTVVAWEKPVYFVKGLPPETFEIQRPFYLLIANSNIASSTREAVAEVRRRWISMPDYYNMVFNCIGAIAKAARSAVEQGALQALGTLMNENHGLLINMGVSLAKLDTMVTAARKAGAMGAKLTGAGQGGNIIALVEHDHIDAVSQAIKKVGASKIWLTKVGTDH